jgi:hypothetical protein
MGEHFTPYQLILGTLTIVYALRHVGDIFGLGSQSNISQRLDDLANGQYRNPWLAWYSSSSSTISRTLTGQYTRSYYRATYVNTALDAGFASAMAIRPKWLKDICSVLFGAYYLVYASEGDEVVSRRDPVLAQKLTCKLRKFRALCTVEMLRVTWEKTNNPYVSHVARFALTTDPLFDNL